MFCTVTVLPREKKGLFRCRRCSVEAVQTAVRGGAPFLRLTVTPGKKGVDWSLAEQAAGRSGRFALLPDGIEWPADCRLRRFVPEVLPLKIMLNTAAQALRDGKEQGRSLLIRDENAVLSPYIDCVVPCASRLKVQTERPELYYEAAARVMERFGAAVAVSPMDAAAEAVDAAVTNEPVPNARVNFAAQRLLGGQIPFTVPEEYLRLCPEQIDPLLFLCALYECGGVRAAGELTAVRPDDRTPSDAS